MVYVRLDIPILLTIGIAIPERDEKLPQLELSVVEFCDKDGLLRPRKRNVKQYFPSASEHLVPAAESADQTNTKTDKRNGLTWERRD